MTTQPADAVREALEPCPFCGADDAHVIGIAATNESSVICYACGGETAHKATAAEAIAAWNKRPDRLAALAGAGPDWVMVPRLVTRDMLIAYWNSDCEGDPAVTDSLLTDGDLAVLQRDWNAMLAAAPTAPHAPAKAREDDARDAARWRVVRAGHQFSVFRNGMEWLEELTDDQADAAVDAALATFAEGAE